MGDTPLSDEQLSELLRSIDQVISEAKRLREHIQRVADDHPFWPDRRREQRTVSQGKRKGDD